MNILLLNQYLPPSTAPTAVLVRDLAGALEAKGHGVQVIGARRGYRPGKTGPGRWFFEAADLLWIGLQVILRRRPDLIFCLSSPPGLVAVAALGAWWHRCRLRHWVMDVYPEVAVADGLLRDGLLTRLLDIIFRESYGRCEEILVLDEDMARILGHAYGGPIAVQPPWPPEISAASDFPGWPGVPEGHHVWLYSGNLGRAHLWEPLVRAQALIEATTDDIHLVLQGGGAGWAQARDAIGRLGLARAHACAYVPGGQLLSCLLQADVHIASQAPGMRGLIWPSKLALLTELDAPLIWLGNSDSSISRLLATRQAAQVFGPDQVEALAAGVVGAIRSGHPRVQEATYLVERLQSVRHRSIQQLIDWMGC